MFKLYSPEEKPDDAVTATVVQSIKRRAKENPSLHDTWLHTIVQRSLNATVAAVVNHLAYRVRDPATGRFWIPVPER